MVQCGRYGGSGKKNPHSVCNSCWDADETHFSMSAAYVYGNDVAKQKKTKCEGFTTLQNTGSARHMV